MRVYDGRGRLYSLTQGNLASIVYGYDDSGSAPTGFLKTISQGGRTVTLAYNTLGQLSSITGPTPFTYQFGFPQHDANGRVQQISLPDGTSTIGFNYDSNGNLSSVTPPGRPVHTINYTALDLIQDYVPPDVSIGTTLTRYSYNADRLLSSVVLPDGTSVNYGYDGINRLSTTTYPRGTRQTNYNATNGHLSSLVTADGVELDYTFDGKLPTKYGWTGPVHGSVSMAYDCNWRVNSEQITDAAQTWPAVLSIYDADGLLRCVGAPSLPPTCSTSTDYLTYCNGATLTLTPDAQTFLSTTSTVVGSIAVSDSRTRNVFGELSRYQAGTTSANNLIDIQYEPTGYPRDALGRVVHKVESMLGGAQNTYAYTYDPNGNGRLTDVSINGAAPNHYDYGTNGARSGFTPSGGTMIVPVYDNQDRLTQYGSKTFTYYPSGERHSVTVSNVTTLYNYDQFGNLLSVVPPNAPAITYVIDGQNRRIGKQVGGTSVMGLLYDSQLRVVAQLDGSNHLVSQFVYATGANVPDYMIRGTTIYRILKDQLGSPRVVWNVATNAIAQRMDFDEFGNVITDTNPGFQPFGFAGGLYDPDTLLVRFGARDYDPQIGLWTSKDAMLFGAGDTNLYSYASKDPVNFTDSTGYDVYLCKRVANLPGNSLFGVNHYWIRTDTVEAGMGPANGGIPVMADRIPRI